MGEGSSQPGGRRRTSPSSQRREAGPTRSLLITDGRGNGVVSGLGWWPTPLWPPWPLLGQIAPHLSKAWACLHFSKRRGF